MKMLVYGIYALKSEASCGDPIRDIALKDCFACEWHYLAMEDFYPFFKDDKFVYIHIQIEADQLLPFHSAKVFDRTVRKILVSDANELVAAKYL